MVLWRLLANDVYVRRYPSYDLNIGLIVGDDACLVVDTRESQAAGEELARAVREVTDLPWIVVNTHAHFDHTFGNHAFAAAGHAVEIFAHERCGDMLRDYGDIHAQLAQIAVPHLVLPNRTVTTRAHLDLGRQPVVLHHFGPGHTDHDVVVDVPHAGVVFAGDLVEEGAPPAFSDAFPLDWPVALDGVLGLAARHVVPGHGDVVDAGYVERQRDDIATLAELARESLAAGRPVDEVVTTSGPYPQDVASEALERAFRQLRGDPSYDSPEQFRRLSPPAPPAR